MLLTDPKIIQALKEGKSIRRKTIGERGTDRDLYFDEGGTLNESTDFNAGYAYLYADDLETNEWEIVS
jgi:hypothetical protein